MRHQKHCERQWSVYLAITPSSFNNPWNKIEKLIFLRDDYPVIWSVSEWESPGKTNQGLTSHVSFLSFIDKFMTFLCNKMKEICLNPNSSSSICSVNKTSLNFNLEDFQSNFHSKALLFISKELSASDYKKYFIEKSTKPGIWVHVTTIVSNLKWMSQKSISGQNVAEGYSQRYLAGHSENQSIQS